MGKAFLLPFLSNYVQSCTYLSKLFYIYSFHIHINQHRTMDTIKKGLSQMKYKAQLRLASRISKVDAYKARQLLYRSTTFRLVHAEISKDGTMSLSVVTPAEDRNIRKQVEKNGYYTISHMWGEPKTWVPWTSHGMVGADGKQLSVQMRLEKQQTFMRLFREYPGYWWIDVFCARNDTQLYMMGDVYRFCKKCFALLDFPESGFQKVQTVSKHLQSLESFTGVIDSYKQRIDGKSGSADQSWSDTLTDLMGGWYEGSQDDIAALATFFDCKWFTRVWTLQEYLLPQTLFFMSECDTKNTMLDRSVIEEITDDLGSVVGAVLNSYIDQKFGTHPRIGYLGFSKDQHAYAANAQGVSRCYFDMSRIATFEIVAHFVSIFHNQHGCNLMDLRHVSLSVDPLVLILVHFASLPRTCLFPCDYIYGVAGLLGITIPNCSDQRELWSLFRATIHKRAPHLAVPEQFDLSEAKDMHDVYNIFLGEDIVNQLDRIDNILGTTELIEAYAD